MLQLRIVSPTKVVYTGEVDSIEVPGYSGRFEVLNHHAAILSLLVKGNVRYKNAEGEHSVAIEGGFITVKNNEVTLSVEQE